MRAIQEIPRNGFCSRSVVEACEDDMIFPCELTVPRIVPNLWLSLVGLRLSSKRLPPADRRSNLSSAGARSGLAPSPKVTAPVLQVIVVGGCARSRGWAPGPSSSDCCHRPSCIALVSFQVYHNHNVVGEDTYVLLDRYCSCLLSMYFFLGDNHRCSARTACQQTLA